MTVAKWGGKKVREEHLLNVMLPYNPDGLSEESPDECLASQCHSDDHKGHWQDGLRQISWIIRSIRHLSVLRNRAWSIRG